VIKRSSPLNYFVNQPEMFIIAESYCDPAVIIQFSQLDDTPNYWY
jgi:hypothetical protein